MAFTWFNAGLSQKCLPPRHCPRDESQVVKRLLLSGQFLWCQPNSSATLSLFCWSFGIFSEKFFSGCSVCQDGMTLVGSIAIYLFISLSYLYMGHINYFIFPWHRENASHLQWKGEVACQWNRPENCLKKHRLSGYFYSICYLICHDI